MSQQLLKHLSTISNDNKDHASYSSIVFVYVSLSSTLPSHAPPSQLLSSATAFRHLQCPTYNASTQSNL